MDLTNYVSSHLEKTGDKFSNTSHPEVQLDLMVSPRGVKYPVYFKVDRQWDGYVVRVRDTLLSPWTDKQHLAVYRGKDLKEVLERMLQKFPLKKGS